MRLLPLMRYVIGFALLLLLISITYVKADDLNVDLGRHMISGGLIVKSLRIPQINNFSYTNFNYPFLNHYWLTEVIFYLMNAMFGLMSLFFLKELLILFSVGLILFYSLEQYGSVSSGIASLLVFPFFIVRNPIRPELFGYLFFAIILSLLLSYPKHKNKLIFLPFIMVLWINLNITFVYGVLLIGVFFLKLFFSIISKAELSNFKKYLFALKKRESILLILSIIVLVINPHGIYGILEPVFILNTPVYYISEMQSIYTVVTANTNPIYLYIMYLLSFTPIFIIYLFVRKRYVLAFILATVLILSMMQNRNIMFLLFIFIPSIAFILHDLGNILLKKRRPATRRRINLFLSVLLTSIILFASLPFFTNTYYKTFDVQEAFGSGFYQTLSPATNFLLNNNLPKNVFNNFDMAGYFIYKTYPRYKPFIDNRPEAFPANFINNTYFPVFNNKILRKKIFQQYNIKTVILQLDSGDQGARLLTVALYKDPSWKLAYADGSSVIFTKDKKIKDLKSLTSFFQKMIKSSNNYLALGKLASTLVLFGDTKLVNEAILKAYHLNSNSCTIKRILYETNMTDGQYSNAQSLEESSWHCLY